MKDIDFKKSDQDNAKFEQLFSKAEKVVLIKTMSNYKAHNLTGITPAFYKVFWCEIGDTVTDAVNSCLENQSSPQSKK